MKTPGINNVTLLGRLTRDPEMRQTPKGREYVRFAVAILREPYRENKQSYVEDDAKEGTDFVPCVCWVGLAKYLSKFGKRGALIGVEGSFQTGRYQKDGQTKYTYEVMCRRVKLYEFPRGTNFDEYEEINTGYLDPDDLPF